MIAARRGEGASTVARARRWCGGTGHGVCDRSRRAAQCARARLCAGRPCTRAAHRWRLGGAAFHQIVTQTGAPCAETTPAFSYHRIGRSRLYVGAFDSQGMPQGGRVLISSEPDYWRGARAAGRPLC
ncbi:MAG: hypothetical protein WDM79_09260 [Terricaulis sp.]